MTFAGDLSVQIASVCPPLVSVKIGTVADKSTWVIDAPGATSAQLAAAQSVVNTYDVAGYLQKEQDVSDVTIRLLQVQFNHENRIRALEGKAAITRAQFVAGVKSLPDPT